MLAEIALGLEVDNLVSVSYRESSLEERYEPLSSSRFSHHIEKASPRELERRGSPHQNCSPRTKKVLQQYFPAALRMSNRNIKDQTYYFTRSRPLSGSRYSVSSRQSASLQCPSPPFAVSSPEKQDITVATEDISLTLVSPTVHIVPAIAHTPSPPVPSYCSPSTPQRNRSDDSDADAARFTKTTGQHLSGQRGKHRPLSRSSAQSPTRNSPRPRPPSAGCPKSKSRGSPRGRPSSASASASAKRRIEVSVPGSPLSPYITEGEVLTWLHQMKNENGMSRGAGMVKTSSKKSGNSPPQNPKKRNQSNKLNSREPQQPASSRATTRSCGGGTSISESAGVEAAKGCESRQDELWRESLHIIRFVTHPCYDFTYKWYTLESCFSSLLWKYHLAILEYYFVLSS